MTDHHPKPPETIAEAIARLEAERAAALTAKESADSAFADADGRLEALQKLQADIDKATEAYEGSFDQLKIEQQAYDDYDESERECLEDILGHLTGDVDRATAATDTALANAVQRVASAEHDVAAAERDRNDKDNTRLVAAGRLTALQQLAATIAARHGLLRKIRDAVNKAHQDGDYALAYWLLKHGSYRDLLNGEPMLIDPDELPAALLEAVNALGDAEEALASCEATLAKQRQELTDAEAELADRKAKGEAELRDQLKTIVPSEA